jgi:hypothetical protein
VKDSRELRSLGQTRNCLSGGWRNVLRKEIEILEAAMRYGKLYHRAHKSKLLNDRKKFIRAEIDLGWAALAIYAQEKERRRVKSRRNKS